MSMHRIDINTFKTRDLQWPSEKKTASRVKDSLMQILFDLQEEDVLFIVDIKAGS